MFEFALDVNASLQVKPVALLPSVARELLNLVDDHVKPLSEHVKHIANHVKLSPQTSLLRPDHVKFCLDLPCSAASQASDSTALNLRSR